MEGSNGNYCVRIFLKNNKNPGWFKSNPAYSHRRYYTVFLEQILNAIPLPIIIVQADMITIANEKMEMLVGDKIEKQEFKIFFKRFFKFQQPNKCTSRKSEIEFKIQVKKI